jgi:hypothetical protein
MGVLVANRALIIANQRYRDEAFPELPGARQDAAALRKVLADPAVGDFDVSVLRDASVAACRRSIEGFFRHASREDLLVLHVSCHGIKNRDNRLFLAASDTEKAYLASTGIDCTFISDQIEGSPSRQVVLFLDCCYSGAFLRGFRTRSGSTEVDVAEPLSGRGRIVITASTALQFSHESTQAGETELTSRRAEPSIFTSALVEGLRTGAADLDGDGLISVDELYEFVHRRVRETIPAQTPTRSVSSVEGTVFIAHAQPRAAPGLPLVVGGPPSAGDLDLVPFAGLTRAETEHDVVSVALETSLAYQGRRVVISRDDLIAKLSDISLDKSGIAFTMPDLITVLENVGIRSDPPGSLFKAHTVRVKSTKATIDELRLGHPVLAGAVVRQVWMDEQVMAAGELPTGSAQTGPILGGKVILILGYRTTPAAFRILTPWPTWGQSGLGWIPTEEGLFDDASAINAYEAMPTNADAR